MQELQEECVGMIDTIIFILLGVVIGYIYGSIEARKEKCKRRKDLLERIVKMSQEYGLYDEEKCLTKK